MKTFNMNRAVNFCQVFATIILCLLGISSRNAYAQYSISNVSLKRLTATSTIIVVGRITAIQGETLYDGKTVKEGTAHIQVDNVIKGDWDGKPLYFTLPEAPLPLINWLVVGEYGLFFLKSVDGKNVPVDPFHIMLPIREGMPPSEESQDALSSVRDEILFTALGPFVLSKEDQYKRQAQQAGARKLTDPGIANMYPVFPMNLTALGYLAVQAYDDYGNVIPSNEHAAKALKTLLSTDSSNSAFHGNIISTLLALGQFDVLDDAVKFVDAVSAEKAAGVAQAIVYVNGAKYIPDLGNLLQNQNVEVRRSAINSLAKFVYQSTPFGKPMINLKDSVTLPFLVKALDDNDSEVRHRALRALPRATNKPSWDLPRLSTGYLDVTPQEEQKLIAQWKQWWESEGSKAFDAGRK